MSGAGGYSVRRRAIHRVDYEDLDRPAGRFEPDPELLLQRSHQRWQVRLDGSRWITGRRHRLGGEHQLELNAPVSPLLSSTARPSRAESMRANPSMVT